MRRPDFPLRADSLGSIIGCTYLYSTIFLRDIKFVNSSSIVPVQVCLIVPYSADITLCLPSTFEICIGDYMTFSPWVVKSQVTTPLYGGKEVVPSFVYMDWPGPYTGISFEIPVGNRGGRGAQGRINISREGLSSYKYIVCLFSVEFMFKIQGLQKHPQCNVGKGTLYLRANLKSNGPQER